MFAYGFALIWYNFHCSRDGNIWNMISASLFSLVNTPAPTVAKGMLFFFLSRGENASGIVFKLVHWVQFFDQTFFCFEKNGSRKSGNSCIMCLVREGGVIHGKVICDLTTTEGEHEKRVSQNFVNFVGNFVVILNRHPTSQTNKSYLDVCLVLQLLLIGFCPYWTVHVQWFSWTTTHLRSEPGASVGSVYSVEPPTGAIKQIRKFTLPTVS